STSGVESLTPAGRDWLDKDCKLSTEELRDRLLHAKRSVPFVQANLIMTEGDDPALIARWRQELQRHGVWANEPVPLFPYPGSPEYRRMWGLPDDDAWERALDYYLDRYSSFSDIQEARPRRLAELETRGRVMPSSADHRPTVLMTADAVGGVWNYALTLCAALPEFRFVLAVLGPAPSPAQRSAIGRLANVVFEEAPYRLEWMAGAEADLAASRHWLVSLARRHGAGLVHVNGYAHARIDMDCPILAVAHSDVLSWWQAVHREPAPAEWDDYRREVAAGLMMADRIVAPSRA